MDKGKHLIQTKSVDELNYFRKRLVEAQDDFKNLFPKDLPPNEGISIRNAERHISYHNLQLDIGIPGGQMIGFILSISVMEKS